MPSDYTGRKQVKMFVLADLKDTIRIAPEQFHLKLHDAIKDEINRKLANKVTISLVSRVMIGQVCSCQSFAGVIECRIVHRIEGH